MNITPLEIRQKAFATQFRGYDKDEVDAFLLSMSQEWERVNLQMREQQIRAEGSDKELMKLREVESSLFKTLKTAEDTSTNLIEQANRSADLQIKESQMNAEALINDARVLAKDMIEEAEMAIKNSYDLMNSKLKDLEADYKSIESARANLIDELRGLATNILDKTERAHEKDFKLEKVEKVSNSMSTKAIIEPLDVAFSNISSVKIERPSEDVGSQVEMTVSNTVSEKVEEVREEAEEEVKAEIPSPKIEAPVSKEKKETGKSFFDED